MHLVLLLQKHHPPPRPTVVRAVQLILRSEPFRALEFSFLQRVLHNAASIRHRNLRENLLPGRTHQRPEHIQKMPEWRQLFSENVLVVHV